MGLSLGHIIVLLLIVFVLFGAGKLPHVMGDLGKGLRNFKNGLNGIEEEKETKTITAAKKDDDSSKAA